MGISEQFGMNDVAQALMPAASALLPTLGYDALSETRTRVEMSGHARRRSTEDEKTKRPEESGRGRHECPRHVRNRAAIGCF
jgi:hypothetical protein